MFNFFHRPRATPRTRARGRFFRPLLEVLESRELLALTISSAATANVSTVVANGTTAYVATSTSATLDIDDVNAALAASNSVLISGGLAGSIVSNLVNQQLANVSGRNVSLLTGNGVSDITLAGLQLSAFGSLTISANRNVTLTGNYSATTLSVSTTTGSITMPSGGELAATTLDLEAGAAIGAAGANILSAAVIISAEAGAGGVFITEKDGGSFTATASGAGGSVSLTSLDGSMTIVGPTGNSTAAATDSVAISSNSAISLDADINAGAGTILIGVNQDGAGPGDFIQSLGADISTTNQTAAAISITVNTPQAGTGIAALGSVNAGTSGGVVTVNAHGGDIIDNDADSTINITAFQASLLGRSICTAANPFDTDVNALTTDTSGANGDQNLREANRLQGLELLAGNGNVTLTVTTNEVTDSDPDLDIVAKAASITLSQSSKPFGDGTHAIQTSVDSLSVVSKGDQQISEFAGLTALNLNTTSLIELTVRAGAVSDSDAAVDITAKSVNVSLNDLNQRQFGSFANPIATNVDSLQVDTTTGGGSQFIEESDGLTALDLRASSGNVTLTARLGSVLDSDPTIDIAAQVATITLSDTTAKNLGDTLNPIHTSINNLSVDSSAGGGDQFISDDDSTILESDAGAGAITLVGGTFDLDFGAAIGNLSTLVVNSPAVVNLAFSGESFGGLAGDGTVAFKGNLQLLTVGENNADTTFSGVLTGGIPQAGFMKAGSGTLTLSGNSTFPGEYRVQQGKLLVNATLASNSTVPVIVINGAVLGGTGVLNRPVTVFTGGTLAPGASLGNLSTEDLAFKLNSFFDVEIANDSANGFDQVFVTGSVVIDGGVKLNLTKSGTVSLQSGDVLMLIDNDGAGDAITGMFKDLPEAANLGSNFLGTGLTATITYKGISGNDNDVVIKLSPGSLHPWHNDVHGLDVTNDNSVVPADVVAVVNYINAFGPGPVPANAVIGQPFGFLDTDKDNNISPNDVVQIINFINAFGAGLPGPAGEGVAIENQVPAISPQPAANGNLDELIALLAANTAPRKRR
jgi:autotransporter-associated beta strand protein